MLYGGITLKQVLSGASRIRNKTIATVFAQMHIIDDWGTSIQKIMVSLIRSLSNLAHRFGLIFIEITIRWQ